jgi:L-threonylcarbamoyladenylate synthase
LKKRDPKKPCIILISHPRDLKLFNLPERKLPFWPGPVSVVFNGSFPLHLARGGDSLAFRVPKNLALLKKTGPLIAPSANPEGMPPARNIREAKKYFQDKVDFYLPGPTKNNHPSVVVKITR